MAMTAFFTLLSHKITSSIPVMLFLHKPLVIRFRTNKLFNSEKNMNPEQNNCGDKKFYC